MLSRCRWIPLALVAQILLPSCFTIMGTTATLLHRDEIVDVRATEAGGLLLTLAPRRVLVGRPTTLHLERAELEGLLASHEPWPRVPVSAGRARSGQPEIAYPELPAARTVPLDRGEPETWSRPAPIGWSVVYTTETAEEHGAERARFELLLRWAQAGAPDRGVILVLTDAPRTAWDELSGILACAALDGVILLIALL